MSGCYGVLAEFRNLAALTAAVHGARAAGLRRLEAFTPFPDESLAALLGAQTQRISAAALMGGLVGAVGGYFLQWYSATIDYPIDVGGRPLHSWPAFLPITFEVAVLGAALAAFVAMLLFSGLPRLRHPLFEIEAFRHASRSGFFLCVLAGPDDAEVDRVIALLRTAQATEVWQVPA